jgi:hypothetical protein
MLERGQRVWTRLYLSFVGWRLLCELVEEVGETHAGRLGESRLDERMTGIEQAG